MSDFKTTPEMDLNIPQLLERYQIQDESTLRNWAKLHGINGNRSTFSPQEVDLIDHVHHHLHNLHMSVSEYQHLVNRRSHPVQVPPQPMENYSEYRPSPTHTAQSNQPVSEPAEEDMSQQTSDAIEMLMEQYSEAIDYMGEQIADNFINELDASVMRHLVKKVKARQQTPRELSQPNRLMKAIQVVFQSKQDKLLTGSTREESGLQMESNHRLG